MEFIKVKSSEDCVEADGLLNALISYESDFDDVINGNCVIKDFHKECIDRSHVFAYYVKDGEEAVGYIFAYLKNIQNDIINSNVIVLESLFVKEKYRRQKVGSKLIFMLEKWAKDTFSNYIIEITSLSKNESAIKFYESLGYRQSKVILRK